MSSRSNITVPSGPGGMSGSMGDPNNQPMDLVQKNTGSRTGEPTGIVKGGVVHFTASGVAQILTTSGTTHVVTTKPVSRGDGGNVGIGSGQTVTLVSRTGPTSALNLAGANSGPPQPGSMSNSTLRTIPSSQSSQSTTITPYHIPRGPAQVAHISAPRSQSVATPILRTPGQSGTTGGRGGMVSQRVVSTGPGGWGRGSPSPAHSGKMVGQQQGITPVGRGTNVGGPRGTQPPPSITTYHAGVRGSSSGSIRAATTTMRGVVDGNNPRGPQPKALHIAQTQKYGLVGGSNRVVTTIGSGNGGGTPTGMYASGPQLVTSTLPSGTPMINTGPGPMRAPAPPTIAVRITTPPVPTATSTSQVTSQAGGGTISGMMTTSSGATMISHHPTTTMQHRTMDPHTTLKNSPIVRAPVSHQTNNKTNMAAFSGGPKVITESAQPPSLTLSQLSGLTGVTAQKPTVNSHATSHSHANVIPRTVSSVVPSSVGRLNIPGTGGGIPVAKVLPQQQHQGMDRGDRLSSSVSISGPVPPGSVLSLGGGPGQQHSLITASSAQDQHQGQHQGHGQGQHHGHSQGQHHPSQPPHTNVFLHRAHAGVSVTSGGISVSGGEQRVVTSVPQYTGITTTPYFFDQNASGGPTLVPGHGSGPQYSTVRGGSGSMAVSVSNAVTVTAVPQGGGPLDANMTHSQSGAPGATGGPGASNMKPTASPRPSILRKRADKYENDGPLKAARNLSAALVAMPSPPSPKRPDSRGNGNASSGSTTISANSSPGLQMEEMDSHNIGHVPHGVSNSVVGMALGPGGVQGRRSPGPSIKQEPPDEATTTMMLPVSTAGGHQHQQPPHLTHQMAPMPHRTPSDVCSPFQVTSATTTLTVPTPQLSAAAAALADGLSPRKKPRKQQLMGNELQEARSSEDDFDHPALKKNKRDCDQNNQDGCMSDDDLADGWEEEHGHGRGRGGANSNDRHNSSNSERPPANGIVLLTNRPQMSLINSVRQNWKPRHNHFARHSDVRPKDEKKPTVNEIANQKLALQRVNGWKVVHLGGQVEDLVDLESDVVDQLQMLLSSLEKRTHHRKPYKEFDKDVNRLSELVKANVQRSKIIKDQMTEARTQMHKLFDHKTKIVDIMTKYGSKRSLRKKEKT